jgi:hypothetical protein
MIEAKKKNSLMGGGGGGQDGDQSHSPPVPQWRLLVQSQHEPIKSGGFLKICVWDARDKTRVWDAEGVT